MFCPKCLTNYETEHCVICAARSICAQLGAEKQTMRIALMEIRKSSQELGVLPAAQLVERHGAIADAVLSTPDMGFEAVIADSLAILAEASRVASMVLAHDAELPPSVAQELMGFSAFTKTLVDKYKGLGI